MVVTSFSLNGFNNETCLSEICPTFYKKISFKFLQLKNTNTNCKQRKAVHKTFRIFLNFFRTFSLSFDPKTVFFDSKTQFLHCFFKISELKFPNFFLNFFAKFHEFKNSVFFKKISELRQPNISETCKNKKFGKFCLMQGLNIKC